MTLAQRFKSWKYFFEQGIWDLDTNTLSKGQRVGVSVVKVLLASAKGFAKDGAAVKASALTYYSLLSFVPVLAVAFAIAKGFGLEASLDKQIRSTFAGQEEIIDQLISFSHSSLENIEGGLIAGISIVFLLFSVVKLLNHIESAFNAVWNIKEPRPLLRKLTEYITLILIGPVFVILSSGVSILINSVLNQLSSTVSLLGDDHLTLEPLIKLTPFFLMTIFFTILYIVIPNKMVKPKPALLAGIVAGIAFTMLQNGYVYFQVAMSRYNAIYGSFAALPLFLIWLQISWMIILFGAEMSFAINYRKSYKPWDESADLSLRKKQIITLAVLQHIAQRFEKGEPEQSIGEIAKDTLLADVHVHMAIEALLRAELIKKVVGSKKHAYLPSKSLSLLTLEEVKVALEKQGENGISPRVPILQKIAHVLEEQDQWLSSQSANQPITQISQS